MLTVVPLVAAAATPSVGVPLPFFFFLFFFFLGRLGSGVVVVVVPPPLPGPIVNIDSRTLAQWDLAISTQFMMLNGLLSFSARSQAAWTFSDNRIWCGLVRDRSAVHINTPISTALVDSQDDWWRSCMRPSLNVSMCSPRSPIQLEDLILIRTVASLALRGTRFMTTSTIHSTIVFVQGTLRLLVIVSSNNGKKTFKVSESNNFFI